jgi:metal-sulfur cluster biosynthetic enzyme
MEVISNNQLLATIAVAALYDVCDPELGLNVVDLGLIYQVDFDEATKKISACMTLTTQFCPMGESLTKNVQHVLENVFGDYEVQVHLTFNPAWNAARISTEGQAFLNR